MPRFSHVGVLFRSFRFTSSHDKIHFPLKLNKDMRYVCQVVPRRLIQFQSYPILHAPNPGLSLPSHLCRQNERMEIGPYFINYVKVGSGPHVVFCFPGILGSFKIQLQNQILGFDRDKFTFITWDQPGYGLSRPPERIFTDDSLAEDADYLAKFMKRLGYSKFSVMGWSGGGCSALLFAIKYPHLINKLVTWGAFSYVSREDAEIFKWFSNPKNTAGRMRDYLVDEYGLSFFEQHFPMWMQLFERIYSSRRGELCSKSLHKITAPTLVLHGAQDGLVMPRHAQYLRDHIPNSRLEIWEGGKHNINLRFPDRFNEVVQRFLLE